MVIINTYTQSLKYLMCLRAFTLMPGWDECCHDNRTSFDPTNTFITYEYMWPEVQVLLYRFLSLCALSMDIIIRIRDLECQRLSGAPTYRNTPHYCDFELSYFHMATGLDMSSSDTCIWQLIRRALRQRYSTSCIRNKYNQ
jgi:hypothetical protein